MKIYVETDLEGISGVVIQPLMSDKEDYFFTRSWWNCQKEPWLLEEMKQTPDDWYFWSDIPYRQAKWIF